MGRRLRNLVLVVAALTLPQVSTQIAGASHPPVGFTWYDDGSAAKQGGAGTVIRVYATFAFANRDYRLVTSPVNDTDEGCEIDVVAINPNVRRSSDTGVIGVTGGAVNRPPGMWRVCFLNSTGFSTVPVLFTVL